MVIECIRGTVVLARIYNGTDACLVIRKKPYSFEEQLTSYRDWASFNRPLHHRHRSTLCEI